MINLHFNVGIILLKNGRMESVIKIHIMIDWYMESTSYVYLVHIEISKGSSIKYEFDHKHDRLICDRVLHTPFTYFFNYGYIPETLGGDGDPVDVVMLSEHSFCPTSYVKCKVIGLLETIDENGVDDKIIMVPIDHIDPRMKGINDIEDIDNFELSKVKYFYENYKKMEPGKWSKVGEFKNREYADKVIVEGFKNGSDF
jgi:inorganic pyrophosphatase